MYCSSCGAKNTGERHSCASCGIALGSYGSRLPMASGERAPAARRSPVCPRCGYEGMGLTYFSRGRNVAALVGLTVLTAGMMGAGGIAFYLMRREHTVCPRCGRGWGHNGERAAVAHSGTAEVAPEIGSGRERFKRGWSVVLFLLSALMVVISVTAGEAVPLVFAGLAALGGVALRGAANSDRERRRAALVTSLQLPVLKLAADRGGRLTVTQVAAELGWPLRRAEKILHSLDDGIRVDSEVTDEGVIVYEFRELLGPSGGDPSRWIGGA